MLQPWGPSTCRIANWMRMTNRLASVPVGALALADALASPPASALLASPPLASPPANARL